MGMRIGQNQRIFARFCDFVDGLLVEEETATVTHETLVSVLITSFHSSEFVRRGKSPTSTLSPGFEAARVGRKAVLSIARIQRASHP
jgi:hypothetical protein